MLVAHSYTIGLAYQLRLKTKTCRMFLKWNIFWRIISSWKTKIWVKTRQNYNETLIFRLYFKVISIYKCLMISFFFKFVCPYIINYKIFTFFLKLIIWLGAHQKPGQAFIYFIIDTRESFTLFTCQDTNYVKVRWQDVIIIGIHNIRVDDVIGPLYV